jgi:hypothetical protein
MQGTQTARILYQRRGGCNRTEHVSLVKTSHHFIAVSYLARAQLSKRFVILSLHSGSEELSIA